MAVIQDEYVSVFTADTTGFDKSVAGLQAALAKFQESLARASGAIGETFSKAPKQIDPLVQAFKDLGIKSQESLQQTAAKAQEAFRLISSSGKASSEDLVRAQAAVDKALAATEIKVKEAESSFSKIKASISGLQAGFAAAGLAAPFLALGAAATAAWDDIKMAYRQIIVGTGAVGADLAGLKDSFAKVFADVPASAADVGAAMTTLAQLTGATGTALESLTKQQVELAHITGAELRPQVEATTKAFNNWKISTDQQGPALETLFRISQLTGTSVTKLAETMSQGGAAARTAGLSFETTALLIGQLSKVGIDASSIFQGFNIAMRKIAQKDPSADPSAVLADLIAKIKGAGSAAESNKIAVEAFGRSGIQMGEAIKNGRLNVEELTKALAENKNTIEGTADKVRTFGEMFEILKNKVELALAPLGQEMSGVMKSLIPDMDAMANIVKQISDAFGALPENARQAIAAVLLGFGVGGPIIAGLTLVIGLIGGPLTAALVVIGGVLTALTLDWIDGMDKDTKATVDLQAALTQTVRIIGILIDAFGVMGHTVLAVLDPLVSAIVAIGEALAGKWTQAMETMQASADRATKHWEEAWADLNGKWEDRLTNMIQDAYKASDGFGAAGAAAGSKYGKGLSAGIQAAIQQAYGDPFALPGGREVPFVPGGKSGGFPVIKRPGDPGVGSQFSETYKDAGAAAAAAGSGAADKFLGSFGKKAGAGMSKAMADAFQDGLAGLKDAVAKVSTSNLDILFDPISKKMKAGAEDTKNALKAVATAINEFLNAEGIKGAKVNITELATSWDHFQGIIGKTEAWKALQEGINNVNIDRLTSGLNVLDESLKIVGTTIEIPINTFKALQAQFPGIIDQVHQAGFAFKQTFPIINEFASNTGDLMKDVSERTDQMFKELSLGLKQTAIDMKVSGDEAPHWAGAIVDSAEKIKKALAGDLPGAAGAAAASLLQLRAALDIHGSIDGAISEIERYGAQILHLTGGALQEWVVAQSKVMLVDIPGITKEGLNKALDEHRKAAIQLPGIWNDVFNHMTAGAKEWAGAVFGVLDSIPGAFGSAVKKVTSTIEQWMKFFDSILGLLHKFVSSIPDSIGSAVSQISGILKGATSAVGSAGSGLAGAFSNAKDVVSGATKSISNSAGGMSDNVKTALGAGAMAATGFATSMALAASSSSKSMGLLEAGISATIAGITAAMAFTGPIGAIVGGLSLVGGIIGMFKGKSAAQKQQEALQLQQLKDQVAQDSQTIVNTYLDGMTKALDFLNRLDDFTQARKANFRAFFAQLTKLMDWFVELSKAWGKDTLDKAKAFADTLGPIVDAIANAPAALEAIGQYIPAASFAIDAFFNDLQRVVMKFGELADSIANDFQKRARKFAERVLPVTDVIKSAVEGLAGIMNFAEVPKEAMDLFGDALKMAVLKMTEIADQLDQSGVKAAARFADRAGVITGLLKSGVEGLMALATLTPIAPGAFDIFFDGIKMALSRMSDLAQSLDTDMLSRAVGIANAIIPISAAIKAWAEAANAVRDYTAIAESVWQSIADDLQRTFHLLDMMLASAIDYIPVAMKLEDVMSQIAQHLKGALTAMGTGLQSAASAFGAMVGAIEGGVPLGGSSLGGSTFGAQSVRTGGSASTVIGSPTVVQHIYPSAGMDEQALADMAARAAMKVLGKRDQRFKTQVQMG